MAASVRGLGRRGVGRLRAVERSVLALLAVVVTLAMAANGVVLAQGAPTPKVNDARRNGSNFMSKPLQAMQDDLTVNPGSLWVSAGEELWRVVPEGGAGASTLAPSVSSTPAVRATKSCMQCHGELAVSMRGVAAKYPRFASDRDRVISLSERINACRVQHQGQQPLGREHNTLLQLESAVVHASRGLPIDADAHPRTQALVQRGEALYVKRIGQLDLSCAQCHDERAGERLGGSTIPQAHPTGYPLYRLEWQRLGSLGRRLRACLVGVRAEPFAADDEAWMALEAYLAKRAHGMTMESPAIRP